MKQKSKPSQSIQDFITKYGNNSMPGSWSSDFISKSSSFKTRIWKISGNGSPWQNLIP